MYVCILSQDGEILLPRTMKTRPELCLQAMAPSREELVVAVDCLFPWYWLADRCAHAESPGGLGHARAMQALHGGTATNDTSDAQKIAVRLRGGLLPQAEVSPADMRATRELRRCRLHLVRKRAELVTHVQHTTCQDTLPEMGQHSAYKANRDGVAERCPAPAVQNRIAGDLTLLGPEADRLRELALPLGTTAKQHDAHTLALLQTGPGIGTRLRLVLVDAIHAVVRVSQGHDVVASGRLVTGAQESAGQR